MPENRSTQPTASPGNTAPQASASDARHPVDEVLPLPQLFTYGLQHVLVMYAGAIAVPLIVGMALKLSPEQIIKLIQADLFTCGIATIIQTVGFWKLGSRLPIVQGCTFVAVSPMIMIGQGYGITSVYGSVIIAGLFMMLVSPFFSRLLRFFPTVVIGSIITLIGISLLPVGVNWAAGGQPNMPQFGLVQNIGMAAFVLCVIMFFYGFFKGFIKNIAILPGLIVGLVVAYPLGMVKLDKVASADWISVTTPFQFGLPTFDVIPVVMMALVMLVTMTETTGDFLAVGEIVGKRVSRQRLADGLRADGFSSMLGGIFNCFPYTAFAQNVGLVSVTQAKSRFTVAAAGVILVALGLFPKLAALVAAVPQPVLGGAGIVMFGMVAASGIRTLAKVRYEGANNAMIVAVTLGTGLIPVLSPTFFHAFSKEANIFLHSGITIGAIVAIVLNIVLNRGVKEEDTLDAIEHVAEALESAPH